MKLYNKFTGNVSSYLKGVYVSNSGSVAGPWTRIADSRKLANSGSALKQSVGGKGYGPGIQAWYNQFLAVDPADPNHVYVGLEEVYETRNGGSTWKTVGPYWNFYFGCWGTDLRVDQLGCNLTTHPDQHAIAFGKRDGKAAVFVGNDGGVYARPVAGQEDREGHATDWESLNDGTMDVLQYYAVDAGDDPADGGDAVSGGLQDNGGSILRAGDTVMGSNFGGDGGDVLVNPDNGCEIVQEYVYLSLSVTRNCKYQDPSDDASVDPFDPATSGSIDIAPPDPGPRFIAPFARRRRRTSTPGSPAATSSGPRPRASPSPAAAAGSHCSTSAPAARRRRWPPARVRRTSAGAAPATTAGSPAASRSARPETRRPGSSWP